jgi:formylglycine-generating enzyme required for sulfatase activity
VLLRPTRIADRLVSCGDYLRSSSPTAAISARAVAVRRLGQRCSRRVGRAPAYWLAPDDPRLAHQGGAAAGWQVFGLHGVRPLAPEAPVSQLSFYEAAAYAEWAGARLPTEFEWEAACADDGMTADDRPRLAMDALFLRPVSRLPPAGPGVAAEYNGKFMVGQLVLRGGSVATPAGHTRPSYRNFFPPAARWQFSGLRLAKDL